MADFLNKKISIIVSIIGIIIVAISAGGFFIYQYQQTKKEEIKLPEIKKSSEVLKCETEEKITYRNEKYGFEFEYPVVNENNIELDLFELPKDKFGDFSVVIYAKYDEEIEGIFGTIFYVRHTSLPIDTEVKNFKERTKNYPNPVNVTDLQLFDTIGKKVAVETPAGLTEYMLVNPKDSTSTIIIQEGVSRCFPVIFKSFKFIK